MKVNESIIIGIDISENEDTAVLLVGRRHSGRTTEIINAYQGEEAIELYTKLTTKKDKCIKSKKENEFSEEIKEVELDQDESWEVKNDYIEN